MAFKDTVKEWFKTGLKPTQAQFYSKFDFLRWKDEKIPITDIDDIENILAEKADAEVLENHLTDETAHADLFAKVKISGRFLINRNNLMFFADEPIEADTVTGMVEGEYLNAGTFYGGNFEALSSYVEPVTVQEAFFNISSVVPGVSITFGVVAGTDKSIQYYIVHYSQFGDFISATPFSLDQLLFEDSNGYETYTYPVNVPNDGQINIQNSNEQNISNLYTILFS